MGAETSKQELLRVYEKYRGNNPRLKRELKRLLKKGEDTKDIFLIGAVNYYLALVSHRLGHRTSILSYAIKAVSMLDQTTDYDLISRSYNLLGIGYIAQEDYQSALNAYQTAYQTVCRHRNCTVGKDTVQNNIAECYYQIGDYKRSIRIMTGCFELAEKNKDKDPEGLAIYGINLSDCYESVGDCAKADEYLDEVESVIDRVENSIVTGAFYSRRACVAYKAGDMERGTRYADKCIELVKNATDTYELHRDFEKIAHAQIRAGEYDRADQFADILLLYSDHTGHVLDMIIAYRVQADYFQTIGDNRNALAYYSRLNELYEKHRVEEKAMHLATRKKIEATEKAVKSLMRKIKTSQESAEREPLTGLMNRTALLKTASEFVERAKRENKKLGGIFVDIDFFKQYNDTYGHSKGDEVIRAVADACRKENSASVRFARYGGDEFFALTLGRGDEALQKSAARICAALREAAIPHEKNPKGRVTLSVGVANITLSGGDETILDVINFADKAVYQAKASGKDTIYVFELNRFDESGRRSPYYRVDF
ncbi:MAG: GGDEF domain-containing protein [Oscillospiraceae bacterium]|nr:GGDEF domain-containing protein [Oscillospiraceae bacterium]